MFDVNFRKSYIYDIITKKNMANPDKIHRKAQKIDAI